MLKLFPRKWYQCARCGKIDRKVWSEEECAEEYKENFPNDPNMEYPIEIICDDCYNEFKPWLDHLTPKKREEIEHDYELEKKYGADLEKLEERFAERFAKIFPIHVSGDLNKLDINKLLKFAEENKGWWC